MDDDHQNLCAYGNSYSDGSDHFEEFPKFGIMLCVSSTPSLCIKSRRDYQVKEGTSSQRGRRTYQTRDEKDIKFE